MKKYIQKEVKNTIRFEISEEEIEDLIIKHFNLTGDVSIKFNVSYHTLQGAVIKAVETEYIQEEEE